MGQGFADAVGVAEPPMEVGDYVERILEQVEYLFLCIFLKFRTLDLLIPSIDRFGDKGNNFWNIHPV